jgi:hypothetical protein
VPDNLDIFSDEFVTRFAAFAGAAAEIVSNLSGSVEAPVPFYCPINEMSFWAWVGGDVKAFAPHREGQGPELKRQLVRASLAAIAAVRAVDPRARFVHAEPIIKIVPDLRYLAQSPKILQNAKRHTSSQYEAWDMLRGDMTEELGGAPEMLDIIGGNYYRKNQWVHEGDRTPPGYPSTHLHKMLHDVWERYRRPIVITEIGAEAPADVGWLGYISAEVRQAQRDGVEILGVCLYPVMDYPGWDDERHCPCGLIAVDEAWKIHVPWWSHVRCMARRDSSWRRLYQVARLGEVAIAIREGVLWVEKTAEIAEASFYRNEKQHVQRMIEGAKMMRTAIERLAMQSRRSPVPAFHHQDEPGRTAHQA